MDKVRDECADYFWTVRHFEMDDGKNYL